MTSARYTGRTHNNIRHGKGCACPLCDPNGVQLQAAVKRARESLSVPVKVVATPEGPAVLQRRAPRYRPPSDETRRMAELLRAGKSAAQAIEIIESETALRKVTP